MKNSTEKVVACIAKVFTQLKMNKAWSGGKKKQNGMNKEQVALGAYTYTSVRTHTSVEWTNHTDTRSHELFREYKE